MIEAVSRYEQAPNQFVAAHLVEHAHKFSREHFMHRFRAALGDAVQATGITLPGVHPVSLRRAS
jgi:hypothetical protein